MEKGDLADPPQEGSETTAIVPTRFEKVVIEWDKDGIVKSINEQGLSFFGFSKNELIGKNVYETILPMVDSNDRLQANLPQDIIADEEGSKKIIIEVKKKNGERAWMSWENEIVKGTDGSVIGLRSCGFDITERVEGRRKLLNLVQRVKELEGQIENGPAIIFKWESAEGWPIIYVSKNIDNLGFSSSEMMSRKMPLYSIIHKDDIWRVSSDITRCVMEGTRKFSQDYRIVTPKGEVRWVESHIWAEADAEGNIDSYNGLLIDVTNRKKLDEELNEYYVFIIGLLESYAEGLIIVNSKSRVLLINRKFVEMWSLPSRVTSSKNWNEIFEYMKAQVRKPEALKITISKEAVERGSFQEMEVTLKDGRAFEVGIQTLVTKNEVTSIISTKDITSLVKGKGEAEVREEYERLLIEKERLLAESESLARLGEVASLVSHDLKSPLQAILNTLYLMNLEVEKISEGPKSSLKDMISMVEKQVGYSNKILLNLQDFSRSVEPRKEKIAFGDLVNSSFNFIENKDKVKQAIEGGEVELFVDKDMMIRVLVNLTNNAAQASPNGVEINYSAVLDGDKVKISVKDNAGGIPTENLSKIFTLSFTTKAKGMGLGLMICKKFVLAHGGTIDVQSEPGKGTTFTINLPRGD